MVGARRALAVTDLTGRPDRPEGLVRPERCRGSQQPAVGAGARCRGTEGPAPSWSSGSSEGSRRSPSSWLPSSGWWPRVGPRSPLPTCRRSRLPRPSSGATATPVCGRRGWRSATGRSWCAAGATRTAPARSRSAGEPVSAKTRWLRPEPVRPPRGLDGEQHLGSRDSGRPVTYADGDGSPAPRGTAPPIVCRSVPTDPWTTPRWAAAGRTLFSTSRAIPPVTRRHDTRTQERRDRGQSRRPDRARRPHRVVG